MKKIFTVTFVICVAVFVYNIFSVKEDIPIDGPSSITTYEFEPGTTDGDVITDKTSLKEVQKTLIENQDDRAKQNMNQKQSSNIKEIKLERNEIIRAESPMARGAAKSYKEVTTLELEGEDAFKLTLDQALEKVGSVVLVSLDGPMLIHNFSANEKSNKSFKEGQETMKGDWVKLDNIQGDLKSIELEAFSKLNNRVRVYVQYFGKDEDL